MTTLIRMLHLRMSSISLGLAVEISSLWHDMVICATEVTTSNALVFQMITETSENNEPMHTQDQIVH